MLQRRELLLRDRRSVSRRPEQWFPRLTLRSSGVATRGGPTLGSSGISGRWPRTRLTARDGEQATPAVRLDRDRDIAERARLETQMRELDGGKDDVHLSPYSRAKRERMSALAALAVPDAILVSFYRSRLRLASPLAQRGRDRDRAGPPALPVLHLLL